VMSVFVAVVADVVGMMVVALGMVGIGVVDYWLLVVIRVRVSYVWLVVL